MTLPSTEPTLFLTRASYVLERVDGMTCVVITYPDLGTSEIVRPNAPDYAFVKRHAELQAQRAERSRHAAA